MSSQRPLSRAASCRLLTGSGTPLDLRRQLCELPGRSRHHRGHCFPQGAILRRRWCWSSLHRCLALERCSEAGSVGDRWSLLWVLARSPNAFSTARPSVVVLFMAWALEAAAASRGILPGPRGGNFHGRYLLLRSSHVEAPVCNPTSPTIDVTRVTQAGSWRRDVAQLGSAASVGCTRAQDDSPMSSSSAIR